MRPRFGPEWQEPSLESADNQELIAASVAHIAEHTKPLGVFVPTKTGATVRLIAAFRLPVWITAASRFEKTCQDLQFVYGVHALHRPERPASWQDLARECFAAAGPGRVLMTQGTAGPGGGTNRFEILTI